MFLLLNRETPKCIMEFLFKKFVFLSKMIGDETLNSKGYIFWVIVCQRNTVVYSEIYPFKINQTKQIEISWKKLKT